MQTRRETLKQSVVVAGVLASTGLLPNYALAYNKGAFEARSVADAVKALGAGAPTESKDVTITGPDIAENGAGGARSATTLPDVAQLIRSRRSERAGCPT
jgi:sulfur-oxidizing protein SoxY